MAHSHLEKSFGLTANQLAQIRQLEEHCNQFEALTMKLNWNRLQNRPQDQLNDFLYYADDRLVGYLALYIFNQREAEISAMTHPDYRGHGIFRQLLAETQKELVRRNIPSLLFICEQASTSGAQCMAAIGASYEFSEYKMILGEPALAPSTKPYLLLRAGQPDDIKDLARMDELCFNVPVDAARQHLEQELSNPRRRLYVAMLGMKRIGKINVLLLDEETYISGVCLKPEYRGKGYGKTILVRIVDQLVAERCPNISLEVETKNRQALSLYEQCGFQTAIAYDYYRLAVKKN